MKDEEIESMRKVFNNLKDRIEPLVKSPKIQALQKRVIDIRKDAIDNNEELLAIAMKSLKENDIDSENLFVMIKNDEYCKEKSEIALNNAVSAANKLVK